MRLFNLRFVVTLYSLLNWLAAATNITTTTTNTTNSSFFPNPIYDHLACRADNTTFRICDRDGILPYKGRQAVQAEIAKLELFNVTCGGGGGAHQVVVVPVQMGVALIRTVRALWVCRVCVCVVIVVVQESAVDSFMSSFCSFRHTPFSLSALLLLIILYYYHY